jgi:hypothetical protein
MSLETAVVFLAGVVAGGNLSHTLLLIAIRRDLRDIAAALREGWDRT